MYVRCYYCTSTCPGLLKIIQILSCVVVLVLLLWEAVTGGGLSHRTVYSSEDFTIFTCVLTIVAQTLLILFICCTCHIDDPWVRFNCTGMVLGFYVFLLITWAISSCIEIYATISVQKDPKRGDGEYSRRATATAFCLFNTVTCLLSFCCGKYREI